MASSLARFLQGCQVPWAAGHIPGYKGWARTTCLAPHVPTGKCRAIRALGGDWGHDGQGHQQSLPRPRSLAGEALGAGGWPDPPQPCGGTFPVCQRRLSGSQCLAALWEGKEGAGLAILGHRLRLLASAMGQSSSAVTEVGALLKPFSLCFLCGCCRRRRVGQGRWAQAVRIPVFSRLRGMHVHGD